jgi:hypothetical protein
MQQTRQNPHGAPPCRITAPAWLTPSGDVGEFETTLSGFVREAEPRAIVEQTLVDHAATLAWRFRRPPYLESTLIQTVFSPGPP